MDNQTILGNDGVPFTIKHKGKVYPVLQDSPKASARFEQWAKDKKLNELRARKKDAEEFGFFEELKKEFLQFYSDCNSKDPAINYSFNGEKCQALLGTPEGLSYSLRIALGEEALALSEDDWNELLVEHQDEILEYIMCYQGVLKEIEKELGWDIAKNPEGKNIDPKVILEARKILKKAGFQVKK